MRFTKPKKVVGLDIGTHSVKAVQMAKSGDELRIEEVGYSIIDRNLLNTDPVAAHAIAMRDALSNIACNQSLVVGALPGQTVVIRYPRLRNVAEENIEQAIEKEASHNIPYDLSEVLLDWSILDRESDGENEQLKVLLVAAKHEIIESRIQQADEAEIQFSVLGVDSLALADAAMGCQLFNEDETVALLNIGASSVSIHFTRDGVSNFIRDISWGSKELIQAISKGRQVDFETAEQILYSAADGAEESDSSVDVEAVGVVRPCSRHRQPMAVTGRRPSLFRLRKLRLALQYVNMPHIRGESGALIRAAVAPPPRPKLGVSPMGGEQGPGKA